MRRGVLKEAEDTHTPVVTPATIPEVDAQEGQCSYSLLYLVKTHRMFCTESERISHGFSFRSFFAITHFFRFYCLLREPNSLRFYGKVLQEERSLHVIT